MQSFLCNLRQLGGREFESRLVTVVTDRFLMLIVIINDDLDLDLDYDDLGHRSKLSRF